MRRSDRAGMGPEANDHTWCLPRLLAAPGWGLRWVFTFFTLQVLAPEVNKLLNLMYFQRKAVDSFCSEVNMISRDPKSKS